MSEIKVFKRKAWARNPSWPDGWEPYAGGRKTHVCYVNNIDEARAVCKKGNSERKSRGDPFYEFTANPDY